MAKKNIEVVLDGEVVDLITKDEILHYPKFPMTNKHFREIPKKVKKVKEDKVDLTIEEIKVYKNNKANDFVGVFSIDQLISDGYDIDAVINCLSGKQKTHKRMIFKK